MELCLRVANACHGDVQTLAKIDINNTNQYKYPSMVCKMFVKIFPIFLIAKLTKVLMSL